MGKQKKIKKDVILELQEQHPIKWKNIKHIQFEDEDEFQIQWNEPYYSEDNSCNGYYSAVIFRNILETDLEFQKRLEKEERDLKIMKENRYKSYLKLKKEFEG